MQAKFFLKCDSFTVSRTHGTGHTTHNTYAHSYDTHTHTHTHTPGNRNIRKYIGITGNGIFSMWFKWRRLSISYWSTVILFGHCHFIFHKINFYWCILFEQFEHVICIRYTVSTGLQVSFYYIFLGIFLR